MVINMWTLLFWLYLINGVVLINHEIDSAYWKEWNIFRDFFKPVFGKLFSPYDDNYNLSIYLILHIPALFLILYGLILVYEKNSFGILISILMSVCGIFVFSFHMYCIQKGWVEFNILMSKILLFSTLLLSLSQLTMSIIIIIT